MFWVNSDGPAAIKILMEVYDKDCLLFRDQRPLIWRISVHLSGGSGSTYLADQRPLIWRIRVHLSGRSASTYLAHSENKANLSQVELELGLSLAIVSLLVHESQQWVKQSCCLSGEQPLLIKWAAIAYLLSSCSLSKVWDRCLKVTLLSARENH